MILVGTAALVYHSPLTIANNNQVITIGMSGVAYAAGTPDYTCDGIADQVQWLAAEAAAPSNGGRLEILTGNYSFTAPFTSTKRNMVIDGNGMSVNVSLDGINPVIIVGGPNWLISDLATDAGGIANAQPALVMRNVYNGTSSHWDNYGSANTSLGDVVSVRSVIPATNNTYNLSSSTRWWANLWVNLVTAINGVFTTVNTTQLTATTVNISTLNAPTGRGATYVIAASDAPANVKAQADLLTSNDTGIMQAVNALAANSTIALSGTFQMVGGNTSNITKAMRFTSLGWATLNFTQTTLYVSGTYGSFATLLSGVSFDHISFIGTPYPTYTGANYYNNALVMCSWVSNFRYEDNYAAVTSNNGTPLIVGSIGGQGAPTQNQNIYVNQNTINGAGYGVLFNTVDNGWFGNNYINNTNVNAFGAYYGSSRIHANYNTINNSGHSHIAFSNAQLGEIVGNILSNQPTANESLIEIQSKHDGWPYFGNGSSNITVVGNTLTRSSGWGICVNGNNGVADGGTTANSYAVTVHSNTITASAIGIFLDQYSIGTDIRNNTFNGNTKNISDNGTGTIWDNLDGQQPWVNDPATVLFAPLWASWSNSTSSFPSADNYAHNITINGATWLSNIGRACNSASSQSINFTGDANLRSGGNLTVLAWLSLPYAGNGTTSQVLTQNYTIKGGWTFQVNNNGIFRPILTANGTQTAIASLSGNVGANQWFLGAITWDSTWGRGYYNGALAGSNNFTSNSTPVGPLDAVAGGVVRGAFDGGSTYATVNIGTVLISNRAWSSNEILRFYNMTAWRYINN